MALPPDAFFDVAKLISQQKPLTGEARYRTVVGRAYYGAYLATCWEICKRHNINPPTSLPHEAVSDTLARVQGDDPVRKLGDLLNGLRHSRVHADYRIAKDLIEDQADDALVDAEAVLKLLPTVAARLPRVDPAGQ